MDCHQDVTSMMGIMTDVDHDTWNMHATPMCGKVLDPMKHWNIDYANIAMFTMSPLMLTSHVSTRGDQASQLLASHVVDTT